MTGSRGSRSTAERVAAQLTAWSGLEIDRPSCGVGRGFGFRGAQILHLHDGDEADLRLTRPFIDRLDQVLSEGEVVIRPGDDWVTVHLDTDTAGALLISLVSLAIQATDGAVQTPPCTRERAARRRTLDRSEDLAAEESAHQSGRSRALRRLMPLRQR